MERDTFFYVFVNNSTGIFKLIYLQSLFTSDPTNQTKDNNNTTILHRQRYSEPLVADVDNKYPKDRKHLPL